MNKNILEHTNKQSGNNKNIGVVSNAEMASMYDMPSMTSGPSDATLEEKVRLNARSAASKGDSK